MARRRGTRHALPRDHGRAEPLLPEPEVRIGRAIEARARARAPRPAMRASAGREVAHDGEARRGRGEHARSPRSRATASRRRRAGRPVPGLLDDLPAVELDRRSLGRQRPPRIRCSTSTSGIVPFAAVARIASSRARGRRAPRSRARSRARRARSAGVACCRLHSATLKGATDPAPWKPCSTPSTTQAGPAFGHSSCQPPCQERSHASAASGPSGSGAGAHGGRYSNSAPPTTSERTSPPRSGAIVSEIEPSRSVIVMRPAPGKPRRGCDERPRVVVRRVDEDPAGRASLAHLAVLEHDDVVCDRRDDAEIVRDEQDREPEPAPEIIEQVEYGRLVHLRRAKLDRPPSARRTPWRVRAPQARRALPFIFLSPARGRG